LNILLSVAFLHHFKNGYFITFLAIFIVYSLKLKITIKNFMISLKKLNVVLILLISSTFLISCNGKLPGADARKYPADPKKRIENNLAEGRGFRLSGGNKSRGGVFEFASSNELWRASLDTIDFMPLASVNYSGGVIITDWYSSNQNTNESIKISIRFLTNEIRSDAIDVKVFIKKCSSLSNCVISEKQGDISTELKKKILKTAAVYKAEKKTKNSKPYKYVEPD
tara:strand:- start:75 stop:749 length:675 start_codon:yes stop_codon:yes gene_type:complete